MQRYSFNLSKFSILRKYKRVILFWSVMLMVVLAGYLAFIYYASMDDNPYKPQTDIKSENFNPLRTFKTPYFSFDADKSWKFVKKESTDNKFVYRSSKKNIVNSDLTVYVNSLPSDLLLTHVLPVKTRYDRFDVGDISGHCKDYLKDRIQPGNNNPMQGVVEGVSITCQVDGTSDTAGTGLVGGSYQTPLRGSRGTNQYYLLYHDLQFMPRYADFINIAWSFRAL
ncbi:MAG TPA: hypothetical protein VFK11_03625 [Candidatus Saccharimonadales bacterium]|nr:hypothetical protein [Candidatus Saccharimonadales bacterium]